MFEIIRSHCRKLEQEFDLIPEPRKEELLSLSQYIKRKFDSDQTPKLVVICTHNSRRSHIGQIWLSIGAENYKLSEIQTFSGGTEATALNLQAVEAFRRIGLEISTQEPESSNPSYEVLWKKGMPPYVAFSKKYNAQPNPKENFAAIMVCSDADAECPIVSGSDFRLALPYDDPKKFDGTDEVAEKYNATLNEIGREILFALSLV
jgi:hypothetical protein